MINYRFGRTKAHKIISFTGSNFYKQKANKW